MNRLLSDNGFEKKDLLTTGISLTRIKTSKKTSDEKIVQSNNSDDKIRNLTEDKLWAKARGERRGAWGGGGGGGDGVVCG